MSKIILVSATPLERGGVNWIDDYPIFNVGIGKINSAMNMVDLIYKHQPELVINFGSCGNLKNNKVGEVLEVGTVYNNLDARLGESTWRFTYDYPVIGERDISDLDDKDFVRLRRKKNKVILLMYSIVLVMFISSMSLLSKFLLFFTS